MSKLPLDLSKFRKVKADAHTSTLQHPDGHTFTIAHKKLSPKMKGQLEAIPMAEGGTDGATLGSIIGYPGAPPAPKPKPQPMAEAGVVEPAVADSGQIENDAGAQQIDSPAAPTDTRSFGDRVANMIWGGGSPPPQESGVSPVDVPSSPEVVQHDSGLQGPATMPAPAPNQDPFGTVASINQQKAGLETAGAGQKGEQQVAGEQAKQGAMQESLYRNNAQMAQDAYNEASAPIFKARQNLIDDIAAGHINPKRYLDNMSTGGKISTGIGLILGGMGAGLTHGPNLAFQYLQNQIDRDINSQKDELGKKQNLLSHNFQQTHDLREAYNLTKIQTNDVLASHLRQLADQSTDQATKYRLMEISGNLNNNTAQLSHQAAIAKMQQSMFSGQGGPSAAMALETLAPEMRERAVQIPGGGMRLAVTKEGAKEVREQLQTVQPIFNLLDKMQSLGPQALIPGTQAHRAALAMQAQAIPLVNENAGLKRLSAEDIGNIKNMITDPTKFNSLIGSSANNAFKSFLNDKLMNTMQNQLEGGAGQAAKPAAHGNFGFKPRKN